MITIGMSCSCGNTEAFKLSNIAAECTSCSTVHTITDEPTFITRSITPLHVIEQRAKEQAVNDMLDEWYLECHENNIKAELDSIYRRDLATHYGCLLDEELITQKEHDNMIHNLNLENNRFWATCFDTDNIRVAI